MEGLSGADGPLVLHIVLKVSRGMISGDDLGVGCRVSVLTPGGMVMMQLGLLGDGDETDVEERSGVEDAKGCEAAREERKWVWPGLVSCQGLANALLTVPRDRQGARVDLTRSRYALSQSAAPPQPSFSPSASHATGVGNAYRPCSHDGPCTCMKLQSRPQKQNRGLFKNPIGRDFVPRDALFAAALCLAPAR